VTQGNASSAEVRTAVILAAGLGARLADQHDDSPKGFLMVGDDAPIIEESVDKLAAAGIERVVIVTGHLAEYYEKFAASRPNLIETVHNPDYANSGSMYSLYCARHQLDSDFLLLESDLVYEKRALDVLLAGAADAVLMSGPTYAGDEVYIQAPDGLLQQMSKDRDELQSITGELVGISRVSFRLWETMREHAARAFEDTLHVAYETDSLVAAAAQLPVTCPLVEDLLWGEIDDKGHLERVRDQVYPAIERRDG
jgi:2-aminoethylphosphonate-pyruvate transaminase